MIQDTRTSYYEQLEVDIKATPQEIKKAYFKKVRQYPPDKDEEKFKEIREAYEVLMDPNTRQEYDMLLNLPEDVAQLLHHGQEGLKRGMHKESIRIFEYILERYPRLEFIKGFLADAYMMNGNSGKAIKMLEDLVESYPDTLIYASKLGQAYIVRNWRKKGITQLQKVVAKDQEDAAAWMGLIRGYIEGNAPEEARQMIKQALYHVKDEKLHYVFYHYKLMSYAPKSTKDTLDEVGILKVLDEIQVQCQKDPTLAPSYEIILANTVSELMEEEMFDSAKFIADRVKKWQLHTPEVKQIINQASDAAPVFVHMQSMEERGIGEELQALIELELALRYEDNKEELLVYQKTAYMEIIDHYHRYHKQIQTLKLYFPEMYAMLADFLDQIDTQPKRRRLMKTYEKDMREMMGSTDIVSRMLGQFIDEEDFEDLFQMGQTVVNTPHQDVSRNAPCPCGSGKKYKKCCGK